MAAWPTGFRSHCLLLEICLFLCSDGFSVYNIGGHGADISLHHQMYKQAAHLEEERAMHLISAMCQMSLSSSACPS